MKILVSYSGGKDSQACLIETVKKYGANNQTFTGSIEVSKKQYKQLARHRLTNLLSALPKGAQKRIAQRCHCAPSTVSNVLNGKQTQCSHVAINIIRVATEMAKYKR